jgi:hypothetical protein
VLTQELLFNVTGQSFFYDPPEGRASGTPTVQVFAAMSDDAGPTVPATTGACSVDSVNTTFSANAGDTSATVASGTGITRGRRYLVTDTDGDREWVECISVLGTTVGFRVPLRNSYAAGSTFQGCRISISADSTFVATSTYITDVLDPTGRAWLTMSNAIAWIPGAAGYRLRWAYTVNSTNCIGVSFADLVRYQAKNLVTPLDVDTRFPGWIDRLPTDFREDQGQALIDEAYRALKLDALGDDQVLRRIRNTEVIRDLILYRANLLAVEASLFNANAVDPSILNVARELYQQRYDQLIRQPKVPVDQMGSGAAMDPVRLPLTRR